MRLRTALHLPREHGAWGMLYTPLACGALVALTGGWRLLLLTLSVTFVFIARESVLAFWRAHKAQRDPGNASRFAALYLALASVSAAPLILVWNLLWMIPLGAASFALLIWNASQAARREERAIATELTGILGLTLTAPAAHYVAVAEWTPAAWWLWALNAAYYSSSVFYVKLRVATAHPKDPSALARIRSSCAFYHWGLAVALLLIPGSVWFRALIALAYVPVITRAIWHIARPTRELVLRRIGLLEIAYSLVFLLFTVLAFHVG